MIAMLKRVFQILHGADKTLYQSLKASLVPESSSYSSGEEVFAVQLIPLLHPHVQRLFVGMYMLVLSMKIMFVLPCYHMP